MNRERRRAIKKQQQREQADDLVQGIGFCLLCLVLVVIIAR